MNTWKVICATLVIFVAGIVTGGVAVGFGARVKNRGQRPFEMPRSPGGIPGPQALPKGNNPNLHEPRNPLNFPQNRQTRILSQEFLEKLHAEVQLTQGQRERIEEVVTEGQQRNKEIMDRVTPELRRVMMETQKRIREILDEKQRVRFEELMKQQRPQQRRMEEPGQPGTRRDRRPSPPNSEGQPDKAP